MPSLPNTSRTSVFGWHCFGGQKIPPITTCLEAAGDCSDQQSRINKSTSLRISLPVSLWLFGAHVGVGRLLGDKDTANLAQVLVHLKGVSRIVIDA